MNENDVSSPDDATLPLMVPVTGTTGEAQKTEPDKNTYLVFRDGLAGADSHYDYGTHFLFQGPGATLQTIDGSTWDPWAKRLIFTTESPAAPIYAATPGYPSTVDEVSGALGRGGYEGVQNDDAGDLRC